LRYDHPKLSIFFSMSCPKIDNFLAFPKIFLAYTEPLAVCSYQLCMGHFFNRWRKISSILSGS
jgi:hypothetical protein